MSCTKKYNLSGNFTRLQRLSSIIALIFCVSLGSWLVTDTVAAGTRPNFKYTHTPSQDFIANQRTPVSVFIEATEEVQNVRLYFRTFSVNDYFFIELNPDGNGNYTGELPAFDESVTSLEYLFLWKIGSRRIVRTTPYRLSQVESGVLSQSIQTPLTIFTEMENGATGELDDLVNDVMTIKQVPENQHYGMRVGLFDMSGDKRYRHGYFGGFIYEPENDVTYAIEGYVNFVPISSSQKDSQSLDQPSLTQTPEGYPNVAGDDWSGVFYRTDSSSRTNITAVITHNGHGGVSLTTTLSGRGHYLTGSISSGYSGELYMTDHWDDEIWTTHRLDESTSIYFGIEDYVYKPSSSNPDPPLYRIELTRPEPKEPADWLPPILELLLLG